jgi:hypothetical protein
VTTSSGLETNRVVIIIITSTVFLTMKYWNQKGLLQTKYKAGGMHEGKIQKSDASRNDGIDKATSKVKERKNPLDSKLERTQKDIATN